MQSIADNKKIQIVFLRFAFSLFILSIFSLNLSAAVHFKRVANPFKVGTDFHAAHERLHNMPVGEWLEQPVETTIKDNGEKRPIYKGEWISIKSNPFHDFIEGRTDAFAALTYVKSNSAETINVLINQLDHTRKLLMQSHVWPQSEQEKLNNRQSEITLKIHREFGTFRSKLVAIYFASGMNQEIKQIAIESLKTTLRTIEDKVDQGQIYIYRKQN